jgi:hypothetical protein
MSKKRAFIIIGEKFVSQGLEFIKSANFNPPMPYDGLSIQNTIRILEKFNYRIELLDYYDFRDKDFNSDDLFIVSQYILNRFKDTIDVLRDIKRKVNSLVGQGNTFILMHHFWRYDIFNDVLDIEYYIGKNQDWFRNRFELKILKPHPTTLNIDTFVEYHSSDLKSDEFTFLFKDKSKFVTLIQKIPKTKSPKNFISFGYQKNGNSYIFLIDVHDIGEVETHSFYFDMLLNNTLNFLNSH